MEKKHLKEKMKKGGIGKIQRDRKIESEQTQDKENSEAA